MSKGTRQETAARALQVADMQICRTCYKVSGIWRGTEYGCDCNRWDQPRWDVGHSIIQTDKNINARRTTILAASYEVLGTNRFVRQDTFWLNPFNQS